VAARIGNRRLRRKAAYHIKNRRLKHRYLSVCLNLRSQLLLPASGGPQHGCPRSVILTPPSTLRTARGDLLLIDELARSQDEDLAHHVGMLLIAAHEADHAPTGRAFALLDRGAQPSAKLARAIDPRG
jgi:hypothetical protein